MAGVDGAGELRERVERLRTAASALNVIEASKVAADAFERISCAESLAEARDYAERALLDMAIALDDGQVAATLARVVRDANEAHGG